MQENLAGPANGKISFFKILTQKLCGELAGCTWKEPWAKQVPFHEKHGRTVAETCET